MFPIISRFFSSAPPPPPDTATVSEPIQDDQRPPSPSESPLVHPLDEVPLRDPLIDTPAGGPARPAAPTPGGDLLNTPSLTIRPLVLQPSTCSLRPHDAPAPRGRPYSTAYTTRMHVGVGVFSGTTNYIAAQFPNGSRDMLLNEITACLDVDITPATSAHLTLIPPTTKLNPHQNTRAIFKTLGHSTLTFKRAVITQTGGVLLIPEDTTSARELKKRVKQVAEQNHLPHQKRELHIVLGHLALNQVLDLSNPWLYPYRGSNPLFVFEMELIHPFSINLSLTAEGNLIAEQITPRLEEVPVGDRAPEDEVATATNCFKERVRNVDILGDKFIVQGYLTESDYEDLDYDYAQSGVAPYQNNPIHFTPGMLDKARAAKIPLSYQMVPLAQIPALTQHVGSPLRVFPKEISVTLPDGTVEIKEMAIIDNPEVVLEAFSRDLEEVFAGFDDVVVQQVGSGVSGFSRNPGKPLKPSDTVRADIDLAIKSRQLLEHLDQSQGISGMSVNHKVKLSNRYTVLANGPKAANETGFAQTTLGEQIRKISQTWSHLLAGQSPEESALDPMVDFKLNINPTLFADAATILNQPGVPPQSQGVRFQHSLVTPLRAAP